ncbi:MAG: hypothetical protein HY900_08420 [Deltaproteobacteria bacterium]|nr:hypothetical protein [Deltaproteobacteria bacterium]
MHRTQVLLEEQQYLVLRNRAQREGKSLGALIRDLIDAGLRASQPAVGKGRPGIGSLKGMVEDPGFDAKDHDAALYGKD